MKPFAAGVVHAKQVYFPLQHRISFTKVSACALLLVVSVVYEWDIRGSRVGQSSVETLLPCSPLAPSYSLFLKSLKRQPVVSLCVILKYALFTV